MIGVDWGTTSLRAYRIAENGAVTDRIAAPQGILAVPAGGFAEVLRGLIAPWLAAGETRVLLSGMVGSRQGWIEAPYCPCPAGASEIAASVVAVPFEGATVRLVPGLSAEDADGTPEVMRGEETQIVGAGLSEGIACLPGSHSKWVHVAGGRITGFATYFSGEAFAAMRGATILGRMMADGPSVPEAFARGLVRSGEHGHLLHHLFGVRALGLFGRLAETESASYLSGLLIGHEIRAALPAGVPVSLVGAAPLCALYAEAIAACGGSATILPDDIAARGLALIGSKIAWT